MPSLELEAMASALEASGEYRVLRRLPVRPALATPRDGARLGLVLEADPDHPLVEKPGMLRRGEVVGMIDAALEHAVG